ncbi:nucleotidyltransferase domain-containing protein [Phocaeicola sp.]
MKWKSKDYCRKNTDPKLRGAFLELVKCSLGTVTCLDPVYFNWMEEKDWDSLFRLVQKHSVTGICFPVIELLPIGLRPPSVIYLKWFGQVQYIKATSFRMREMLHEVNQRLEPLGVFPVLMKGLGIACWYPNPSLRMAGDIDLYIPGDYNEVIDYVEAWGFLMTYMPNHDKVEYKGVCIELHHQLIRFPIATDWKLEVAVVSDGFADYRIPDADTNALLLLTHAVKHLIGPGVGIRHLCDWAVFLRHNHQVVNFEKLWKELEHLGLKRFAIEFTALAYDCFQVDCPAILPWCAASDERLKQRLLDDIIERGDCGRQNMEWRRKCKWFAYYITLTVRLLKFRVYCPKYMNKVAWHRVVGRMKFVFRGDPFGSSLKYTRQRK